MIRLKEFFLLNIIFPLAEKFVGTNATKWYRQIKTMDKWSSDRIEEWQDNQLRDFIKHAYNNTIYYRKIFDDAGLRPEDIKNKDDLVKLPIINKEIVAEHFNEIVPSNIKNIKYRKARTGGTTGEPMYYYCDENTWGYVTGAKINAWKKAGYAYGEKFIVLGSASLFPKNSSIKRKIYDVMRSEIALNGMNMSDDICKKYVDFIKKKKTKYLYGYASSIYLLTKYVKENHIDLTQITTVFTTSEKLTDEYRALINQTYECSVMDCYGAKDAGVVAFEVNSGEYEIGYNVIPEVINPISCNTGTLLTTNFLNYAFPLIRYEFGDEAMLSENKDNYNGQIFKQILGRTSDVIRLSNGNNVTGPGFTILMKPFDIVAYELKKVGDLEVELKIQPNLKKYTKEQENDIRQTIHKFIGVDCKLNILHVEKFDPLKNGKRRYFMQ
ncbi:MAG: phenylacetate-CoA ligase [Patiriisocius sp.]|jgi:phenylacetate-CoA ligase